MKTIISKQPQPSPRTKDEIFTKGIHLMERKRFAAAQKNFDIVLLLEPGHTEALLQRGICKLNGGLVSLALDDFSEILAESDGKPEANAAIAKAYWMLADYTMAKKFIDQVLGGMHPMKAEWYELGFNIYNKLGTHSMAYTCINRAIVCNPFDANLYYKRGLALFHLDKILQASNDFSKAIGFNPKHIQAYKWRAQCRKQLNDLDGYRHDLLKAERLCKK
jgi:tetratricopeptide (TPR) repeat protein